MILIENMEMPESCKDCPLREVTERKKDEYVAWLENQIAWDNKKCIGGKK